jgi:uncharacterized protein YbaR (Trm112 family)
MADRSQQSAELLEKNLDRLACPICHAGLRLDANVVECTGCTMQYPIVDGLPVLIAPR